jgi:hypothetical protein
MIQQSMKSIAILRQPQANRLRALALVSVCILAGVAPGSAAGGPGESPSVPDFTRGGKKDDSHDWNLGPTGARGWIHTSAGHSALARQILVTAVAKGSPADGILEIGDVILGVSEKPFADDARKSFAHAVAAAEAKGGVLRLVRWRDAKSTNVELKLPVLGAYSDTAPYDCPKSKKIFEAGCQAIARAGLKKASIPDHLNALALLASGKEEYRPLLADYAPKAAASLRPGTWTWYFGYGNLFLAGRKPCATPALTAKEAAEVIAAGRDYFFSKAGYQQRSVGELMTGLSSWSPAVRKRSAQGLSQREGDWVPTLLKMLAGSERDARYGACEALGLLGPRADAAAPQLRALLKDRDPWLQSLACEALAALGPEARKASVSDLLAMAARHNPADPRGMAQRAVSKALFSPYPGTERISPKSILTESLDGVDRELLYPAIQSVLENDDSVARRSVQRLYGKLTDRDLVALLPAIVKAIRDLAPSNEMFGDDIRLAGLDLVSRLHLREGMPLCLSVVEFKRWGSARRLQKGMECLARYGVHAKAVLPELREMRRSLEPDHKNSGLLDKAIAAIEASTDSPTLQDLKDFKTRP